MTGDGDGGQMTAMAGGVDGGSIGNIWHIAGEKGHSVGAGGETATGDMTVMTCNSKGRHMTHDGNDKWVTYDDNNGQIMPWVPGCCELLTVLLRMV